MPVRLYMDVHVPRAITGQLRNRGLDVLTAIQDGADELPDDQILERARGLDRIVVTQDIGFKTMAEQWQRDGRPFAGLIFARSRGVTVGQLVGDLELIGLATEPRDWVNQVEYLPL